MKKIYTLLFALTTITTNAQLNISFEVGENFEIGTIHNQNGWEVTEWNDGLITNQVITNEYKSNGNYSFKNSYENQTNPTPYPIFGASKSFDTPLNFTDFTISYDVMVNEQLGSDFEFVVFGINEYNEWEPVAGVGIENRGYIYLIKDSYYGFNYAAAEWTPNEWNNIKIKVNAEEIKYYVNDVLQDTIANFSQIEIVGFNMLHNNYGSDAYYDNFIITSESLNVDVFKNDNLSVYPNPAIDQITISSNKDIERIEIYNISGQLVKTQNDSTSIDTSNFAAGTYILKATSISGETYNSKIVKK